MHPYNPTRAVTFAARPGGAAYTVRKRGMACYTVAMRPAPGAPARVVRVLPTRAAAVVAAMRAAAHAWRATGPGAG